MPRTSTTKTDAATLIKLFFEAADDMSATVAGVLTELDLSESQAGMLWALEPNSPPVSMRELARKLRYDPSNITLMTDRLVTAGLVERRPHPTDRRQRILALTDKGVTVWHLLMNRIEQQSRVFTTLTGQEQAQLAKLLAKAQPQSHRLP